MRGLSWRRFSTLLDQTAASPIPPLRKGPTFLPVPHRSIPDPLGQDHDFVTLAHSHLIHAEWPRLDAMAHGLNPFRAKHVLLKIKKDPVLSLEFFDWVAVRDPTCVGLETQSIVLHILTKAKRFKAAEALLKETLIPKTQKSSSALFDMILHSYRLCDSSPRVFDSLFKTYAHMRKFRDATKTFCQMRDYGFFPTVKSCNAYMSSLLDFKRTDIVLSFYKEMCRCRISPNVYTLNMVISAYCNAGKLEKAVALFENMESLGFSPIISTFNTLIAGHCKNEQMATAVKLKNEMQLKGSHPNVITYNTLIYGFCKEGNMHDANKVFSEMKALNVSPNTVTYNTLINGYSQQSNSEMGSRLYEEMIKDGFKADIITYNSLIMGLCNEGKTKKAAYLVKELDKQNLDPNASTFFALLSGQCKKQNSERAFQIYKGMKNCGFAPNVETFNLLITAFCKNEDFEGAVEVLREMLTGWIVPDEKVLVGLFDGLCRSGRSQQCDALCSEFNGRQFVMDCFAKGQLLMNQSESGS